MFCTKCGSSVQDGVRFCTSCGAPMDNPGWSGSVQPYGHNAMMSDRSTITILNIPVKKNVLFVVGGALAAIVIAIIIIIAASGGSKQAALNRLAKGIRNNDTNQIIGAVIPDSKVDNILSQYGITREYLASSMEGELSNSGNARVTMKLKKKAELDEYTKNQVTERLTGFGIKASKIERYNVSTTVNIYGTSETNEEYMIFYKYGGKWYVLLD